MRILPEETGALITDMQERLMPAMWNSRECEERACTLIRGLKILGIPLMIAQQYTKGLGSSIASVYEAAGTNAYFDKVSFSCCRDADMMDAFENMGKKNILVMGTEAHVCVLQTCIDLKAAGFQPVMVVDAVASRKKSDMRTAVARAVQEGILVTTTESILFELTMDAKHPHFKEISNLIK